MVITYPACFSLRESTPATIVIQLFANVLRREVNVAR